MVDYDRPLPLAVGAAFGLVFSLDAIVLKKMLTLSNHNYHPRSSQFRRDEQCAEEDFLGLLGLLCETTPDSQCTTKTTHGASTTKK